MTARVPLCLVSGMIAQLPFGDTLDASVTSGPVADFSVITATNPAGSAVTNGQPVYISAAGVMSLAQANTVATTKVVALVQAPSIASGASGAYQTRGVLTATDWTAATGSATLTAGADYFLDPGVAGRLTTTPPSTDGQYLVFIGQAISATELALAIHRPIALGSQAVAQPMVLVPTTWNPADKGALITLSNGNLTMTGSSGGYGMVRSTFSASSGKWYWEVRPTVSSALTIGVATEAASVAYPSAESTSGTRGYYQYTGGYYGAGATGNGPSYSAGDVIGVALDLEGGTLRFAKNGVWNAAMFTGLSGIQFAMAGDANGGMVPGCTVNFGASAFAYPVPAGFTAGFGAFA